MADEIWYQISGWKDDDLLTLKKKVNKWLSANAGRIEVVAANFDYYAGEYVYILTYKIL